jgi:Cu/Ag efflux protein CusF
MFLILSVALLASCAATEPEQAETIEEAAATVASVPNGTRESPFVGHGVIREVGGRELVIEHETIPGFMAGMTMAFPVAEEAMSDDFEVGDEIMFDIELLEEGFEVFRIERMGAASEATQ